MKGKADRSYLPETNTLSALTYEDYVSYKEKELVTSTIDASGNFSLSFTVTQTIPVFLTADNARAELVVEPGKTYDIGLLAKDSGAVNMLGMTVPVELEFNNSDTSELNYLIADFSNRYEAFLEYHHPQIAKKSPAIFG